MPSLIRMMWPEFKKCWQPPDFGRGKGEFSSRLFEEKLSILTPWFQPSDNDFGCLAFRIVSKLISVIKKIDK